MKRVNGESTISKRSCSAKSQAECKRKLEKLKKQFAPIQGKPITTTKKSYVDYLLTDWINKKRDVEQLEETTIQTHISRINCYFPDFFRDTELQKIDSKFIAKFYA